MKLNPIVYTLVVTAAVILAALPRTGQAETGTLLLFPLTVHADTPMDFISRGAADLMDSRLSERGFTVTRADAPADRQKALALASEQNRDALITGSLTFLGQSVSISLWLIDTRSGETLTAFSKIEPDKSTLFDALTGFTATVSLGQTPAPEPDAVRTETPRPAPSPTSSTVLAAHPVTSPKYPTEIIALSTGDVDGDGTRDIVFADRHQVFIQPFKDGVFGPARPLDALTYLTVLFVDTHDGNGNGIDEIIVTAVHTRNRQTASCVFEWNGKDVVQTAKNLDFFFRKGKRPDTGAPVLLGQEQHFANGYFADTISIMTRDPKTDRYGVESACPLPDTGMNLFAFDTADLFNTGRLLTAAYTPSDHIRVLDLHGEESWISSERYGGSAAFIEPRKSTDQERFYLPARIVADDVDGDGKTEVVTVANRNASPRMFSNLRNFVEGRIIALTWTGLSFDTAWTTQALPGYIPDFALADLNGDGNTELIYAIQPKKASFLSKQTSSIIIQPLGAQ
ncbi:VCBS repeat-containing protein [Desulfatiferula olefinivorans]